MEKPLINYAGLLNTFSGRTLTLSVFFRLRNFFLKVKQVSIGYLDLNGTYCFKES